MRAARAGLRTIVLERGRRLTPDVRRRIDDGSLPLLHRAGRTGLCEFPRVGRLLSIVGAAVGGGSQVYTAVTVPAPDEIFDDRWRAPLGAAALTPCYQRVAEMLRPTPIPISLGRTAALEAMASVMNAGATRLPLAMNWPTDPAAMSAAPPREHLRSQLTTLLRGGPYSTKRTLDQTYLPQAEAGGAEVLELHEVVAIRPGARGFDVVALDGRTGLPRRREFGARRVVLAAGTLGTLRLLLSARASGTLPRLSPMLGRNFFTNGDFGGLLVGPMEPAQADAGPPVTAWIDLWRSDRLYLMETGFIPLIPRLTSCVVCARSRCRGASACRNSAGLWHLAVMGFEENRARVVLNDGGEMELIRDGPNDEAFIRARAARLRDAARAANALLLMPPSFLARHRPVTVHPLGGAAVADSPERGVCDPLGRVFGYPGLYVADGALLPTPIGRAPSMTIAALAEWVSEHLLRE